MEELIRLFGIVVALIVYLLPLLSRIRRGRTEDFPEQPPVDNAPAPGRVEKVSDPLVEPKRARVSKRPARVDDEAWSTPWGIEENTSEEWGDEDEASPELPPTSTPEGYNSDEQPGYTDPRRATAERRIGSLEERTQSNSRGTAAEERLHAMRQRAEHDPRGSALEERARAIKQRMEYDPRGAAIEERARAISLRAERGEQRADAIQERLARVGTSQQRAASLDKRSALIQARSDLIEQRAGAAERLMLKRAEQSPTMPSGKTVAEPRPVVGSSQKILNAWVLRTLLTPRRNVSLTRPSRKQSA